MINGKYRLYFSKYSWTVFGTQFYNIIYHVAKIKKIMWHTTSILIQSFASWQLIRWYFITCSAMLLIQRFDSKFNSLYVKLLVWNIAIYMPFFQISCTEIAQVIETLPHSSIHSQYHGYWCTGDIRSQGISRYGIDLVIPEYSSLRIQRVNDHNEPASGELIQGRTIKCLYSAWSYCLVTG